MAKWELLLILILIAPIGLAEIEVQWSRDNATWRNVSDIETPFYEALQYGLEQDTVYYFRAKNDTTNWAYLSQRTKEGLDTMWLLGLLLIPLGLGFMFIHMANSLEDIHSPLKWFFRLLALVTVFIIFQGANIILELNPDYAAMKDMFDFSVYGWVFWGIMAYVLMYIIYKLFSSFKQSHEHEWDWNKNF